MKSSRLPVARATRRRRAGFTLLEVMVALTICGVVLTAVYGTFSRTLRSKGIAEERAEITRTGRNAVGRMADELASAYYPDGEVPGAIFRGLPGGTESAPLDAVIFSTLSIRPATASGADSDQRVISYFFPQRRRDGASTRMAEGDDEDIEDFFAAFGRPQPPRAGVSFERLLRREGPLTESTLDLAPATAFADNVASLRLRFSDGVEWLPGWDSEDAANYRRLPRAVAIDLGLYDAAGEIHHFATSVDLPLADTRPPRAGGGTPTADTGTDSSRRGRPTDAENSTDRGRGTLGPQGRSR